MRWVAVREAVRRSDPLRIVSAASLPKMVVLQLWPERDAAPLLPLPDPPHRTQRRNPFVQSGR